MTINITFNFKPTAITFKTKNNLFNNLIPFILSIAISIVSMQSHATDMTDVNSLISQAVQTHPLVGSAKAEKNATAESISAAKYNLFPSPSVSSSYQLDNGMVTTASVRQPLWTGGKLSANVNQAIYDDKAAQAYIYESKILLLKIL